MISFNCSCGKKYQLPDRISGREVRCNQCHKPLLVPKQSQDEPVVPIEDLDSPQTDIESEAKTIASTATKNLTDTDSKTSPFVKQKEQADSTDSAWGDVPAPGNISQNQANSEAGETDGDIFDKKNPKRFPVGFLFFLLAAILISFLIGYWIRGTMNGDSHQTRLDTLHQAENNPPAEQKPGGDEISTDGLNEPPSQTVLKEYSFSDWKVAGEPLAFSAKTADEKKITLSLDGNPAEGVSESKKEAVLDDLAAVLSDENEQKSVPKHTVSLKIQSESSKTLRIIWPGEHPTRLDGTKIKEFQFSFYLSDKANTGFKPGKPKGIDQVLELDDISLRLCAETGYVEFVPADKTKLVSLIQRARKSWQAIQIPVQGNDDWKRIDHGLVGPLIIERIELLTRPTGSGVIFWIDHLNILSD